MTRLVDGGTASFCRHYYYRDDRERLNHRACALLTPATVNDWRVLHSTHTLAAATEMECQGGTAGLLVESRSCGY